MRLSSACKHLPSLALVTSLALSLLPISHANIGTITSQTTTDIVNGFSYTNTVSEHTGGRVEGFMVSLSPSSTVYPISIQGSGTIYGGGTISKALDQASSRGYNVLGAINTDYFQTSTGVPLGIVIEDGIYKSSAGNFSSVFFSDDYNPIAMSYDPIALSLTNNTLNKQILPHAFNKYRSETGGLYLMSEYFSTVSTRTYTDGVSVRMVPTEDYLATNDGQLRINQPVELIVTEVIIGDQPVTIGHNNYILTAADECGYHPTLTEFSVGDIITLSATSTEPVVAAADWATGAGDVMIYNGAMTVTSSWAHINEGRAPRTAIGMTADGTTHYYVVDGRQTGYSAGLSQFDLASYFQSLGCIWAVNLDGGGSSALSLSLDPTQYPTLFTSPSDGAMRSAATYIAFVDPQIPTHLTMNSTASAVLTGSTVSLGSARTNDVNGTITKTAVSDALLSNSQSLGTISSQTDTSGVTTFSYQSLTEGTEVFNITSATLGLSGTYTLSVVDSLTSLALYASTSTTPNPVLSMREGESVSLSATGFYGTLPVLFDADAVTWSVTPVSILDVGAVGHISSAGVFTCGEIDTYITATVGGLSATVLAEKRSLFSDVPEDHWSYDAITYLYDNEITSGLEENIFGFGEEIRRGDFMLILYRAVGSPTVPSLTTFTDVPTSHYASTAISWAVSQGIAAGVGNGSFGASDPITREQAFAIIYKALGTLELSLPTTSLSTLDMFADKSSIASYAMQSVATLVSRDIIPDVQSYLYPTVSLTRETMATLIYNILHYTPTELPFPTTLSLSPSEISLDANQSYSLVPMIEPAGTAADLIWSSSDPSALQVSSSGVITNVFTGTGQPVVTITVKSGSLSATCIVRCTAGSATTTTPTTPDGDYTTLPTSPTGTVINATGGLNVRSIPSSSGTILTLLPEGTVITLLGKTEDDWYQVSFSQADTSGILTTIEGYVMGAYIQESATTGTVSATNVLNLRSGAGTAFPVIVQLAPNTAVTITMRLTGWYQVQCVVDGQTVTGFVSSDYIILD